jgi:hypothetical protein
MQRGNVHQHIQSYGSPAYSIYNQEPSADTAERDL